MPPFTTAISDKKKTPEKRTLGNTSFQGTESGAGEQSLPPDCMAKAGVNSKHNVLFTDTGMNPPLSCPEQGAVGRREAGRERRTRPASSFQNTLTPDLEELFKYHS